LLYRTVGHIVDVSDRLGADYEFDGQTDGQTERPLAIARSNMVRRALIQLKDTSTLHYIHMRLLLCV